MVDIFLWIMTNGENQAACVLETVMIAGQLIIGIMYILLFVYCVWKFKRKFWETVTPMYIWVVIFIIIGYKHRGEMDSIYHVVFFISYIMIYISAIRTQNAKHELDKKKLELKMHEAYGDAYKELISEVRKRQHDFANQLGAIYSMHLTASSLEELVKEQQQYGNVLLEKNRYDKILTGCNNFILAGYLYYRCVIYEQSNVQVDYQIHVDTACCCLPLYEVIEILGILLTNAYENYNKDTEDKRIGLVVQENEKNLMIEVSNRAKELTSKEIEKIFSEGYSSKGENRGIGLARVKQLISKVEAELIVINQIRDNENWVNFRVVIPKWEGG